MVIVLIHHKKRATRLAKTMTAVPGFLVYESEWFKVVRVTESTIYAIPIKEPNLSILELS